jgi:hypothetical protein
MVNTEFSSVLRWFPASSVEFAQGAQNGALAVEGAWAKVLKERAEYPRRDPLGQIAFLARCPDDLIVAGRGEVLLVDRGDVVPCGYEECASAMAQVFVQLELQWASPRGTST